MKKTYHVQIKLKTGWVPAGRFVMAIKVCRRAGHDEKTTAMECADKCREKYGGYSFRVVERTVKEKVVW